MGRWVYYVPDDAYVDGEGFRASVVKEGEVGHYPTGDWPYDPGPGSTRPYFWGHDLGKARETAYKLNERMGISREETDHIVSTSIDAQIRQRRSR